MKNTLVAIVVISITVSSVFGGLMGFYAGRSNTSGYSLGDLVVGTFFTEEASGGVLDYEKRKVITVEEENAVITVVEEVSPAVVSIIVTKDLPVIERYYVNEPMKGLGAFEEFFGEDNLPVQQVPRYRQKGTEEREVGGGSGFLVSADGYIITNKHVVQDEEANYTVLMNDESKLEAEVLARDTVTDIAILKIKGKNLDYLEMGDSSSLKVGQNVIAIGNALGEFRNTVSTGVISGLSRSIVAGGVRAGSERLTNVIQTDASINVGNSGGPLLNIAGQVIGVNTAVVRGAQNIGFALPVNEARNIFESVEKYGKIVRPFLGVRYMLINEYLVEKNNLEVDHGALIVRGNEDEDLAVIPGSPADKADLRENDIILEMDGKKIDTDNPLANAIARHRPGETVKIKVLSRGKVKTVRVKLEEVE